MWKVWDNGPGKKRALSEERGWGCHRPWPGLEEAVGRGPGPLRFPRDQRRRNQDRATSGKGQVPFRATGDQAEVRWSLEDPASPLLFLPLRLSQQGLWPG